MTVDLVKAIKKTVRTHLGDLPPAITSKVAEKVVEIAKKRKDFEVDEFFTDFFGINGQDEIRATFDKELESLNLTGEVFSYDEEELPTNEAKKYVTSEGITINMPARAKGSLTIENGKDETVITIRTSRLRES